MSQLTIAIITFIFMTNVVLAKEEPSLIVKALNPYILITQVDVKVKDPNNCLKVSRDTKNIKITSTGHKFPWCAPYYQMSAEKDEKDESISRVTETEPALDPSREITSSSDNLDFINPIQQTTTFDSKGKITSQTKCIPGMDVTPAIIAGLEKLRCITVTPNFCRSIQQAFAKNPLNYQMLEKCGTFIHQLNNAVLETIEHEPNIVLTEKENIEYLNKTLTHFTKANKSYFPDLVALDSPKENQSSQQMKKKIAIRNTLGHEPLRNLYQTLELCGVLRPQMATATNIALPDTKRTNESIVKEK
ncbi:MAG: hypothetical protein A2202_00900 [Bdellovibrionales bacterium RIFOXYA1_FULL_36_14]|nr:MAG: hypothetical protein A2202_00900 [Bdellovibrionales bacterium RIFOXYA1_FULL_36_14]